MASTDSPAHLLSLKVMRVSRPSLASAWQPFYSSSPSFSAHSSASILSLQGAKPLPGHPKTLRDLTHASELLTLPSSFGAIQLGETFSSCLCLNNEAQVSIDNIYLKVEIQTATTKIMLSDSGGAGQRLAVGETHENVVHHEIKELGQHVLACTVTYRLPHDARMIPGASEDSSDLSLMTFRKFYKFVVTNPLSVKTKVHIPRSPSALLTPTEREKVFLEVHIQNLTQEPMCFEKMKFQPADGWNVNDTNVNAGDNQECIFLGSLALLQPQDMRQYIYILSPKYISETPVVYPPGSIIPLGRLDISWRSSFGEPGRLLTSVLSRRIPLAPAQPPPASALPPYLKRNPGGIPSRPQSPNSQLVQSRPATPPLLYRPGSPATNRPVAATLIRPQSPQQIPIFPELDVHLIVRRIPRNTITLERPFTISWAVVVTSSASPVRPSLRRRVALAIQHLQHPKAMPDVTATVTATEPFSPRLPSGYSTPSPGTATFNYTLAHQKILAATPRQSISDDATYDTGRTPSSDNGVTLPAPYFSSANELNRSKSIPTSYCGSSAILLPPIELLPVVDEHPAPSSTSGVQTDDLAKIRATKEFDLTFVSTQKGFTTVGGLRILLLEDKWVDQNDLVIEDKKIKQAVTLKEYDAAAEVWVST